MKQNLKFRVSQQAPEIVKTEVLDAAKSENKKQESDHLMNMEKVRERMRRGIVDGYSN